MSDSVKVHFRLEQDDDGYPPAGVESVWAHPGVNENEYVIDNTPFFARDATLGDTITVREEDGNFWFESVVHQSENSLIRVVFLDRSAAQAISDDLSTLGCVVEHIKAFNLLAVSIPPNVSLESIQDYVQAQAHAGKIDYEEPILRQ